MCRPLSAILRQLASDVSIIKYDLERVLVSQNNVVHAVEDNRKCSRCAHCNEDEATETDRYKELISLLPMDDEKILNSLENKLKEAQASLDMVCYFIIYLVIIHNEYT